MSLSRMKSWLLGYTIELCYNLDIIRLFIKAEEHSNQSWCFLFLNVLLFLHSCYGFPFFSCSVNPMKEKGLKNDMAGKVAVFVFLGCFCPRKLLFVTRVMRAGCSTSSSCVETCEETFWKEQPLSLVCAPKQ